MNAELEKLIVELLREIHANAASGLLERRIITLATSIEQAMSRAKREAAAAEQQRGRGA